MIGRVGMVAIVASLDIALSQWSFEYIDVALYTITKSTSIVFILMWAILLKLEQKHWSLVVIVLMISTGLAMFTYKSTDFVFIGFMMVLSASFLSGEIVVGWNWYRLNFLLMPITVPRISIGKHLTNHSPDSQVSGGHCPS